MTVPASALKLTKEDLEARDRIHRKAVAVVADSIRAMRGPIDTMNTFRQATAISEMGREAAEWNLTAMEQMRAILGFGADVPKDKDSYIQGFHGALVFISGAMSRPWVTVSIEQAEAPKTPPKSDGRLAKLLDELKKATGKDVSIEVVSVDTVPGTFPGGEGDLAKEMMEGLRSLLGGSGALTCAKDDELLNVIRVRERALVPAWISEGEAEAIFDLKPGDIVEERYAPKHGPQGRVLMNRRTGQRAPFTRPKSEWHEVFEIVERVFVCSCNR